MTKNKLRYNNPVEAGFVAKPEDWLYSSAIDFTLNGKGLLELATFQNQLYLFGF